MAWNLGIRQNTSLNLYLYKFQRKDRKKIFDYFKYVRGLKQLALNSIECSIWANESEKQRVLQQWQSAWNVWIDNIVASY